LNLKIFHANGDSVTNEWAAALIGRCRQFVVNSSSNHQNSNWALALADMAPSQGSAGVSEIFEFEVQPAVFTQLRTGGVANNGQVDAVIFSNGARFKSTGRTYLNATFRQK